MAKLKRKTLNKVSKQLAKASKLHAGQSKKIANLARTMQKGGKYTVKKGEYLGKIANKLGKTEDELLALNPQIKDRDSIRTGQKLITEAPSKSIFGDLNLPSGKKIAKEFVQTATGINQADLLGLIPTNAKAFLADITGLGKEEGITEKDLTKREKKALREAIKRAEEQGKDYIEYPDFASAAEPTSDIGGGSFLQGFAPITKYFDPKYSMKTTLGQASFKENKDGTYTVTDEYNFNDASGGGLKGFIADAKVAPGLSKIAPYRILRSVARNFGSAEGEGMPVNVTFQKGGYPKSDKNDFMKRMGYYQGGGLAAPPMYGANTMPGSPETASITYQEADKARLKALEEELKEAQESTKFQDEAEAEVAKQAAAISSIEQGLSQGTELADKLGAFDKLKEKGAEKSKTLANLGEDAATNLARIGTTQADDVSKILADQLIPKGGKVIDVAKDKLSMGLGPDYMGGFGSDQAAKFGEMIQKSNPQQVILREGAEEALKQTTTNVASGLTPAQYGNIGAVASIAGEGIKMASDDQDATTMNVGESVGSGLSGVGTGIGAATTTAMLLGAPLGPVGMAAGVIGGAAYGLGKGLIQRGKARKEESKAERKKKAEVSKIAAKQKLEALKSKEYSGFDFGSDIRQSGGYYQNGGLPNFPAAYRQQMQNLTSQAPKQGEIKATDESLSNKLYQTSQKFKHLNIGPGGPAVGADGKAVKNPVTTFIGGWTGATPAMEVAQSTKNFRAAPSKETAKGLAMDLAGSVPLGGKILGYGAKYAPKVLSYADDAVRAFQNVPAVSKGYKALKADKVLDAFGLSFLKQTGGVRLPGGVAKPIPGSDAIEFKGRSHAQGGIMVDPMTEVEGNETMDQVTMKKGGKSDYFFSQHLKMGGKSFAQRHKDILKNGGRQKDIDALAKLQEKKAGRNPNTVKLGAGGYYQGGGEFMNYTQTSYNNDVNQDGIDDFTQGITTRTQYYPGTTIPIQQTTAVEDETTTTPTTTTTSNTKNEPTNTIENEEREEVNFTPMPLIPAGPIPLPESEIELATIPVDENGMPIAGEMGPEEFDYNSLSDEDKSVVDKANSGADLTDLEKKALKRLGRDVPGLALAAGAAQLIAPAYAFFKKDRVAEQMGAPGRIKAPTLDRVSYNTERAANAADNRAMNRFIETSGIGPAGIIAKMSAYRRKQEGDLKIAAQESRVNTQIANQEAQMAQQANIRNVANAMQRDQINTQLREAQLAANENRRLEAVDAFTERTAGLAGDLMSYKATERLARATGDMGIYERDRLRNFLKNQINPRTGKPYTNADIAEVFNKRFAQPTATEDDKKEKE